MSNNIKIKNTDLVLSKIGFGTVNAGLAWDNEDVFEILERYINLGGNVIDCARIYSDWVEPEIGRAERVIGDWIKHRGKRYDLVIMTKGGHPKMDTMNISRMSKEDMEYDLNLSLKALGIDCIDIYFYHRGDLSQPVSDLIEVMESFVKQGKIRYYGCSNWTTERMIEADNYEELVEHTIRNVRKWKFHGKKVKEYAERIYEIYGEKVCKGIPKQKFLSQVMNRCRK